MFLFVKNEPKYWDFIRNLRSDERIKNCFVEQVKITPEQQTAYMQTHNGDYFICLTYLDGIDYQIPIGFVGVVENDIRIAVIPEMQGKGVGRFMLNTLKLMYPNAEAKVKLDNVASSNLFLMCGYENFKTDDKFKYYRFVKCLLKV